MSGEAARAGAAWESEDERARREACDPTRSFIVRAPAGSGKTELLVKRFLALLATVSQPESILAITFTRKAAAEMKRRILEAMEAAGGEAPEGALERERWELGRKAREQARRQGWLLEELPARLAVETIDSFALRLAGRAPLAGGFGGAPTPTEAAEEYYKRAARETVEQLGASNVSGALEVLLLHLDNRTLQLEQMIAAMLERRDQWLRYGRLSGGQEALWVAAEESVRRIVEEGLARVRGLWPAGCERQLVELIRYAAGNLEQGHAMQACRGLERLPGDQAEDLAAWRAIADFLLTQGNGEGQWRRRVDRRHGFPAEGKSEKLAFYGLVERLERAGLEGALQAIRRLPDAAYGEGERRVIAAVWEVLHAAEERLRAAFRRGGECDFAALTEGATQALGNEEAATDLGYLMDARIEHILVDEFQDTSVSQWRLLAQVMEGWDATDRRTLFLVGDPMQSIYGFREAEVGLFLDAWDGKLTTLPLERLQLRRNFRSSAALVGWVNRTFEAVFPAAPDVTTGAVSYERSVAAGEGAEETAAVRGDEWVEGRRDGSVVAHGFRRGEWAAEAGRVVEIIREEWRREPGARIAVLGRTRAAVGHVAQRLRWEGMPYQAVEVDSLAAQPVIQDLYALGRALLTPFDRVAWLAVLRAPWCGLDLHDLHELCGARGKELVWRIVEGSALGELSAGGARRLGRVREALRGAVQAAGRVPARQLVESAWRALGGPDCLAMEVEAEQAEQFFLLLEQVESGGQIDFRELEEKLAQLYAPADAAAPESLQVMTIHKAKGLEFDVVILPALEAGSGREETPLVEVRVLPGAEGRVDVVVGCAPERGGERSGISRFVAQVRQARAKHEGERLTYVAVTRARRRLHLLGKLGSKKDDGTAVVAPARGLLRFLWKTAELAELMSEQASARAAAAAEAELGNGKPRLRRLPEDYRAPEEVGVSVTPGLRRRAASLGQPLASVVVRKTGNVVHAALLEIARSGVEGWTRERVEALERRYRDALRSEGLAGEQADMMAARVVEAVCNTLEDGRGRWILARHEEAEVEYRITGIRGEEWIEGRVDRTFVDGGERWVVDFKTGLHEGGDLEGFIEREVETYRAQLESYQALLEALEERRVRTGLYFPLLRVWRELTAGRE